MRTIEFEFLLFSEKMVFKKNYKLIKVNAFKNLSSVTTMIYRFFNSILYVFMSYFLGTIFLYIPLPIKNTGNPGP
jgi:hypothetical protein